MGLGMSPRTHSAPSCPFLALPAQVRGSPAPRAPLLGEGTEGTTPGLTLPPPTQCRSLAHLPPSPSCGAGGTSPHWHGQLLGLREGVGWGAGRGADTALPWRPLVAGRRATGSALLRGLLAVGWGRQSPSGERTDRQGWVWRRGPAAPPYGTGSTQGPCWPLGSRQGSREGGVRA